FEDRMLHGIEQACVANEYDLLIVNMSVERDPEVCVRLIRQRRVDGIIVMDPGRNLQTKYYANSTNK
ncbi:MAG: LacI family DNA-binding transcriptional regulator, partial [Lentisphaerae bacterium]|nr:LacI family DNA-binding transcriptional regulator [Lentisphaerota bacterium]